MKIRKVVIITGPGFEDSELIYPYYRLQEAGLDIDIVTSNNCEVRGKYGYPITPTININDLDTKKYEAVIIPGGHEAPDRVRQVNKVLQFLKKMHSKQKIISSICHGHLLMMF